MTSSVESAGTSLASEIAAHGMPTTAIRRQYSRFCEFGTSAALDLTRHRVGSLQCQRCHGQGAVAAAPGSHCAAARKEQVGMIMCPAIQIHHRGGWIGAHDRAAHDVVAIGELGGHLYIGGTQLDRQLA